MTDNTDPDVTGIEDIEDVENTEDVEVDDYGEPVSDPAASGVPEHADPDSSADPDHDVSREADGPAPATMPLDRDDPTVGLDAATEDQRRTETVDERLEQEEPEPAEGWGDPQEGEQAPLDAADPGLDSAVAPHDEPASRVSRLVAPDQGGPPADEPSVVAADVDESSAASAEERAMHEANEPDLEE